MFEYSKNPKPEMMKTIKIFQVAVIASIFLVSGCAKQQQPIENLSEETIVYKYDGAFETPEGEGYIELELRLVDRSSLDDLDPVNMNYISGDPDGQEDSFDGPGDIGGTPGDPVPIAGCTFYYGPTGGGDSDAEDCVSTVYNTFSYGANGDCNLPAPCLIGGSIIGRSKLGEECDWTIKGFGRPIKTTSSTWVLTFNAVLPCGAYQNINVNANGTLVDQFVAGCTPCLDI